ncbi:MAG: PPOX class F420-dependent oxidoreductase [Pseudonocardiales bacterium]|nr:PPOX class F420-dependent oxidoreductase [Pseudonocardiales bacterium]MBV9649789.1 PPOX class F420-dependent oxidoreductase [Pseudonocardiales bacterium]
MMPTFTDVELDYLRAQRLGRLATVDAAGAPQNNPVGFRLEVDSGQIIIGGHAMGKSRKYRNVAHNPYVSFVVDDLASVDPWRVRGVEVRGVAEALADVNPPMPGLGREILRITPRWIGSWGLVAGRAGLDSRGHQATMAPSLAEVRKLVETFFYGYDERHTDAAWLAAIFTEDVTVHFPAGGHTGRDGLDETLRRIGALWGPTLHQTSDYRGDPLGIRTRFTAKLNASHVHRGDDPGAHLHIGAIISGMAIRGPSGTRLSRLDIDLVWTQGDPPTPPR